MHAHWRTHSFFLSDGPAIRPSCCCQGSSSRTEHWHALVGHTTEAQSIDNGHREPNAGSVFPRGPLSSPASGKSGGNRPGTSSFFFRWQAQATSAAVATPAAAETFVRATASVRSGRAGITTTVTATTTTHQACTASTLGAKGSRRDGWSPRFAFRGAAETCWRPKFVPAPRGGMRQAKKLGTLKTLIYSYNYKILGSSKLSLD